MNTPESDNRSVIVVTVTYGERKTLLLKVLEKLSLLGVGRVVVVDNGSKWAVKSELRTTFPNFVDVIEVGKNIGPSKGYFIGIQRALGLDAEYIWLLDDDNCPRNDTLRELREIHTDAVKSTPLDRLAVFPLRIEHQADVAMGVPIHRINSRVNSFRGFHVLDIPYKIWRRTPWGKPRKRGKLPITILRNNAPFGGLFFHKDLIQSIGLPNPDFIIYADDFEFTYRITKSGGKVLLVTGAVLDDLDLSWDGAVHFSNSFVGNLKGVGDFRAYYGMRNNVYLDAFYTKKSNFIFLLNRFVYMSLLFIFSILLGKKRRYRLLCEAVDDGISGRLGWNKRYPL